MGYDEVISLLGDFGPYQRKVYFLLCLPAILCAFHKLGNVFLVAEPKYRCRLPNETEPLKYQLEDALWERYIPRNTLTNKYSQCEMFDISSNKSVKCDEYIYDKEVYGETAVIEWELTCSRTYMIATGNAIFMLGVMAGSIGFGELSDRYGRKLMFFISLVLQVVSGVLAAFSPDFWSFSIARFFIGATTSGVFLVAYVIALEMVGPSKRPIAGTVCHMFFSVGYMLTTVFAIYITTWRSLQLALTLPGVVFLCYWWLIPESTRWLISKNRITEAKSHIQTAAKYNKVTISDEILNVHLQSKEISKVDSVAKQASVFDIFKYPNLRTRALIIFFDWFTNNLTYYGLSWFTNNLSGNPYVTFVISGAVEIPAYLLLIFTLNIWGRKFVMCSCMIVAGISLLLTAIPSMPETLVVILAMIGKLAITSSYGTVYIFSTEQFPTVIRNAGLGAGSTCARLGSIMAPYINEMSKIWPQLPLIIFGGLSLFGGCMSLILPETLNRDLPETMEEGEAFGRKANRKEVASPEEGIALQSPVHNGDDIQETKENGTKLKEDKKETLNGDVPSNAPLANGDSL